MLTVKLPVLTNRLVLQVAVSALNGILIEQQCLCFFVLSHILSLTTVIVSTFLSLTKTNNKSLIIKHQKGIMRLCQPLHF